MSENSQQKGVSLLIMLLLVTVSPTLVLSSDNDTVRLAQAQSANQTSSATTEADTQTPFSLFSIYSNYARNVSRKRGYWNSGSRPQCNFRCASSLKVLWNYRWWELEP